MIITIKKELMYTLLAVAVIVTVWYFMSGTDTSKNEKTPEKTFVKEHDPEEYLVDDQEPQPVEIYNQPDMLYPDVHEHMKEDPRLTIDRMAYHGESPREVGLTNDTCNTGTCSINKKSGYEQEQSRLENRFGVTFTAPFDVNGGESGDDPVGLANDMISGHEDTMENGSLKEHYIMENDMLPQNYRMGRDPGVGINNMQQTNMQQTNMQQM